MINEFKGDHRFLSNFYMTEVMFEGVIYPSSEHAYMAAKTTNEAARWMIRNCTSAADAKKAGRQVQLRDGWEAMKQQVMYTILTDKFTRNPVLREKLLATGDQELIEGNWWNDKIWGVCLKTNQGQNLLGKTLMQIRSELAEPKGRVIAVIGTAGRDKNIQLLPKHWDFMCHTLAEELKPGDSLVSGGAAWADHVAVWAFGTELVESLTLHLPAPFVNGQFIGEYGTSGNACNHYHKLFSNVMGFDSRHHLVQALLHKQVSLTTQRDAMGYGAMFERNKLVARDCTHMVAFTFGTGDVPADGGTKMTWDMAADKQRAHVSLTTI